MYTEFKVYQLNFKPGCPSNAHLLNDNRKYIVASQLYYIAALLLIMKSYELNEWPKTVTRDQGAAELRISVPRHTCSPGRAAAKADPALRRRAAWRARADAMRAANPGLWLYLWFRKEAKASNSEVSKLRALSCASGLHSVIKERVSWRGMCRHFRE